MDLSIIIDRTFASTFSKPSRTMEENTPKTGFPHLFHDFSAHHPCTYNLICFIAIHRSPARSTRKRSLLASLFFICYNKAGKKIEKGEVQMKKIQRVGIIGRGAIGSLYGSLMQKSSFSSFCFIIDTKRKERYQSTPLFINGEQVFFPYEENGHPLDLIMITTKYAGLSSALQQIRPFVNKETILLSCLNGICSEEICKASYPHNPIIRCIVQGMDSTYLQNEVHYTQIGEILIGAESEDQKPIVQTLAEFFASLHIPCRVCTDILREQWNKLMLNCGINQVCARYTCGYGGCQTNAPHHQEFIDAMKEVKAVADAQGITLTDEDIDRWITLVDSLSPNSMPSMAQDICAKRKTELALFSGTILPLAKQHQIEVPVLQVLFDIISEKEKTFAKA